MIYRVVLDGNDILDYSDINLSLISPVLEIEINNAGSLEFVMPPYHKYYDMIRILTSTVEVYEDDILIWFGRPISEKIDFFKQKKVYCEGALSFFNDSVMRPLEIDGSSLHSFFRTLIDSHNGQVASDRTFIVGNITIDDGTVYRKLNYESTYDAIQSMCLSTNDGYLFIRKENGINYIDWLKDMPYECNQQIEFGINLLNYSSNFDASDFVTCVLPIGKTDSETDQPLTIASINSGSDIIISEAAQTYGKVTKPLSLSDISDPYELMTEGRKYLENSQFNALIIECSAADLHSMNKTLDLFRVGQNVHCVSNPHLIDRDFPLSKIQINLDSAAKIITLGIIKRRTLTRIYKQESENAYQQDPYTPDSYDPGVIDDVNGDQWEVIMPDENGGPVTAIRIPIKITIAKPPNKTEYEPGETIDFTGLVVNIWTKDKNGEDSIWTNPPRYLDGHAPMSELSFSMNKAPTQEGIEGFSVIVTWTYKGKKYSTTLQLDIVEEESSMYTDGDGVNAMLITLNEGPTDNGWGRQVYYSSYRISQYFLFCTNSYQPGARILATQYNGILYLLSYNNSFTPSIGPGDFNAQGIAYLKASGGSIGVDNWSREGRANWWGGNVLNVPESTKDPQQGGDMHPV